MLKKILIAICLTLSVSSFTPKAHAGLAIGSLSGNAGTGAWIGAVVGAVGLIAVASTDPEEYAFAILALPIAAGVGALLDAEDSIATDEFVGMFQKKYPFIDNREALEGLAQLATAKIEKQAKLDPKASGVYVTFSSVELRKALETADITDAQFAQIQRDLE